MGGPGRPLRRGRAAPEGGALGHNTTSTTNNTTNNSSSISNNNNSNTTTANHTNDNTNSDVNRSSTWSQGRIPARPEAPHDSPPSAEGITGPETGRLKRVEPKRSLLGDFRGVLTRE